MALYGRSPCRRLKLASFRLATLASVPSGTHSLCACDLPRYFSRYSGSRVAPITCQRTLHQMLSRVGKHSAQLVPAG